MNTPNFEAGLVKIPYYIYQAISVPKEIEVTLFKKDNKFCFEIFGFILLGSENHLEASE